LRFPPSIFYVDRHARDQRAARDIGVPRYVLVICA
jgi:hypothetical protein